MLDIVPKVFFHTLEWSLPFQPPRLAVFGRI